MSGRCVKRDTQGFLGNNSKLPGQYPRKKGHGAGRTLAPWKSLTKDPEATYPFRVAVALILHIAHEKADDEWMVANREWAPIGLSRSWVYRRLTQLMPDFPSYFEWYMGKPLDPDDYMNRLRMFFKKKSKGKWVRCYGPEHPRNHEVTRGLVDKVQVWYEQGFVPLVIPPRIAHAWKFGLPSPRTTEDEEECDMEEV